MRKLNYPSPFLVSLPQEIVEALAKERDQINSVCAPKNRITRMKLIRQILADHYQIVL